MSSIERPGSAVPSATIDEDTPRCVLAVYAHPDDPEVSCAGTLARWAAAGAAVHLVIGTRGEKGTRDPSADPDAVALVRASESEAAASVMGLRSHDQLGHPDGELDNSVALRGVLVERIRQLQPDVVMGPDPTAVFFGSSYVNHHDHREIGFALLDACAPASSSPLYYPGAGPPHLVSRVYLSGTLAPDTWVDISSSMDAKVAALACHESQLGDDAALAAEVVRHRAASAGRGVGLTYAEAFRVLHLG